ncbi:MAG: NAD-dependent epimerase/dehydratase family protein [Anaerolineales bacterium]
MKAFVTGGTGFIGRWLLRDLLAHGYSVAALVRTFERAQQLPRGVRAIPADITKPDSFRHALAGTEVLFHLAGVMGAGVRAKDQARVQRINVEGTRHVLELAAAAGVPRLVYVSSVVIYGNTRGQVVDETYRMNSPEFETTYQRTKHAAHYEVAAPLQQRGAPLVIAVPGAVYGPGDLSPMHGILRRQARGRLPVMVGPNNARSWTFVEDVAVGLRLCAEQGRSGETYNLTGPAHSFREFFASCAQASGSAAPLIWLPSSLAALLARVLQRTAPALAEQFQLLSGVTYLANADKAVNELGWRARPLAEGLSATFAGLEE